MHKIAVIGTGYVGLVTGACLADFGMETVCVDIDAVKVDELGRGIVRIYEPGLSELVTRNLHYRRLRFTTELAEAVEEADVVFIAVGTPSMADGSADLSGVLAAAKQIAAHMNGYTIIVNKSTVPVGAGAQVKQVIAEQLEALGRDCPFDVVSNPEFLREGTAVYDFTHPDKVVIGAESDQARAVMKNVYRVLFLNETPFIDVNVETAEMIKYANNAFLALKISYINEVANLCEKVGANVQQVAGAIGRDGRIGSKFLHAGPGYGGSCFPKDTRALAHIGREHGAPLQLIETVIQVNENQKLRMVDKIAGALGGDLADKRLAVLGLTFKPNTNDMREAPSLTIIRELSARGAALRVYDPVGMDEARAALREAQQLRFCADEYDASQDCDGIVIVTEWHQFRNLDLRRLKAGLRSPYFFDLRNIYDRVQMQQLGFEYYGVGI